MYLFLLLRSSSGPVEPTSESVVTVGVVEVLGLLRVKVQEERTLGA